MFRSESDMFWLGPKGPIDPIDILAPNDIFAPLDSWDRLALKAGTAVDGGGMFDNTWSGAIGAGVAPETKTSPPSV